MTALEPELLFIGGEAQPASDGTLTRLTNPADGSFVREVADATVDDAMRAADAAAAALPGWSASTPKARSEILQKAHALLLERTDRIARLLTLENGKPYPEAQREVAFAAGYFQWFAEQARRTAGQSVQGPAAGKRYLVHKRPVGVVVAITPWNFPATMVTRKLAPALAAGCTVVLKPAPETPLTALAIARVLQEAGLPPGVLNVVPTSRAPEIGRALASHSAVRKLCFTGSTGVGRHLMRLAADGMKRVAFELGGNAPFIVFDDADLARALDDAVAIKYLRVGGQSCICANRFYVHASIHDTFVRGFAERVGRLKVGDGFSPGAQVGPLINSAALAKVERLVDGATRAGADVVIGGRRLSDGGRADGNFYAPTVLTGVPEGSEIVSTEIFGPVAPIMSFESEDEVIARANRSPYGLAGYAYTRDAARIRRMTDRLECGLLGINDASGYTHEVPFGGLKESGIGREGGESGIDAYLEEVTVVIGDA